MPRVRLYTHELFAAHEVPNGHPEHSGRVRSVLAALRPLESEGLERAEAQDLDDEAILRAHDAAYLDALKGWSPEAGFVAIDGDTFMGPHSLEAARHAAGAVVAAVDAVMAGDTDRAFCAVRPPGHHAEPHRAMGFCLLSNIGIGALHAKAKWGLKRVAIFDFDVHHGNGSQRLAERDPDLLVISAHQFPHWPFTGAESETGLNGNVVNVQIPPETSGPEWRTLMKRHALPALHAFEPELILISAGFDAHRDDPLGQLSLLESDYAWITKEISLISRATAGGKLVSALEGGYELEALGRCSYAHVRALMDD
jgi:acetoin utilization deacetylase AcuC-like enzyme